MAAELPPGFKQLRDHQAQAIDEAVELFNSGIDIVYMDAPTGSGKTLIGHQVARELEARALYVCSDKSLQDQFARDFPHGKVLKGRSNYKVGTQAQNADASMCTAVKMDDTCLFCPEGKLGCPYETAKRDALKSDLAVTNTSYLLTEANGPGSFSGRDLVIADEGDTLESILMGYVEYRAPAALVKRVKMTSPKKGVHKKTLVAWLTEFQDKLGTLALQTSMLGDPEEVKHEYNLDINTKLNGGNYQAIIIAVAHNEFRSFDFNAIKAAGDTVVFDTKGFLDRGVVDGRL